MQLDEAFAELKLVQDFIPTGNSNRPGTKLIPRFITIHNTDNSSPGANAAAHAKYQKGQDARNRRVSWHFTVDDKSVYQSLPTNEIGWHAGTSQGNASSIGIEVCMHPEMDKISAYKKAALLVAIMARRFGVTLPNGVVQHHDWSAKHCPRVLRDTPGGWEKFLQSVTEAAAALQEVAAPDIIALHDHDHDHDQSIMNVNGSAVRPSSIPIDHYVVNSRHGLRLRAGPGTDFDIISSLPFGAPVSVVSRFGDWSMVDLSGDSAGDGFVHSAFLKTV
ncbi:N-acetylmuramoyl-L-alanine amidase [Polaromonas glacialis]|uniref:N-acetylmuramoyl-L-alanine amidase n=1 Tax=Polaromonas glacialis TaxID=866564 RepID=UPI000A01433E|nr:N-acetylmuramoyl-L-alanine amidase [Polaromonas glacialis]